LELLDLLAQNKKQGSSILDLASFQALVVIKLLTSKKDLAMETSSANHTQRNKKPRNRRFTLIMGVWSPSFSESNSFSLLTFVQGVRGIDSVRLGVLILRLSILSPAPCLAHWKFDHLTSGRKAHF
jgi:hypothetical protein